jgi:hypothetical protein
MPRAAAAVKYHESATHQERDCSTSCFQIKFWCLDPNARLFVSALRATRIVVPTLFVAVLRTATVAAFGLGVDDAGSEDHD